MIASASDLNSNSKWLRTETCADPLLRYCIKQSEHEWNQALGGSDSEPHHGVLRRCLEKTKFHTTHVPHVPHAPHFPHVVLSCPLCSALMPLMFRYHVPTYNEGHNAVGDD